MKIIPLAVALIFLLSLLPLALADDTGSVKVISKDGNDVTPDNHEEGDSDDNDKNGGSDDDNQGSETIEDGDYIRNEISAGNKLFFTSVLDGLYKDLKGNPVNEEGEQGGVLFSVITYVPNPYEDKTIVELYGGYQSLILYMIVLFIFGQIISRSIARAKLAEGTLNHKNLSRSSFIGGVALGALALIANVFFMLALDITEALCEFITIPAIPELTVNPDNLLYLGILGILDMLVVGFFGIRFFIIYIVAVICGVLVFLLVPESTRDFATDSIEKIIRMLMLQPAALFVTVIGLKAINYLPASAYSGWCLWLTLLVFLTCWYFMFGNYKIIKTAVVFAVRKGVTKI